MIERAWIQCCLWGEDFDPRPLVGLGVLNISDYSIKGELLKKGRRRIEPKGVCQIGLIDIESGPLEISEFLDLLLLDQIRTYVMQAEKRVLFVVMFARGQFNFEFSPIELAKMQELGLVLAVTFSGEFEGSERFLEDPIREEILNDARRRGYLRALGTNIPDIGFREDGSIVLSRPYQPDGGNVEIVTTLNRKEYLES